MTREQTYSILASTYRERPETGFKIGHQGGYYVLRRFGRPVLILLKQKLHPSTLRRRDVG
jgi:hypothetical protein